MTAYVDGGVRTRHPGSPGSPAFSTYKIKPTRERTYNFVLVESSSDTVVSSFMNSAEDASFNFTSVNVAPRKSADNKSAFLKLTLFSAAFAKLAPISPFWLLRFTLVKLAPAKLQPTTSFPEK